jgi:hypothetical protein
MLLPRLSEHRFAPFRSDCGQSFVIPQPLSSLKGRDMTQSRLNRAVARATGESLSIIQKLGFSIVDPDKPDFDPEPTPAMPQTVDWDDFDARRVVLFPTRQSPLTVAA